MSFGGHRELSTDEIVMAGVLVVAVGVAAAHRTWLLTTLGDWLRHHHVLVADEGSVVSIPYLGGLDVARMIIAAGVIGLVVVAAVVRRRRADAALQR